MRFFFNESAPEGKVEKGIDYPRTCGDLNGPIVSKYDGAALQKNADSWNAGSSSNVIFTAHGSDSDSEYLVNSDFYLKDGEYWAYRIYTGGGGSGVKVWEFRNGGDFRAPGNVFSGDSHMGNDGNIYGSCWGGYLNAYNCLYCLCHTWQPIQYGVHGHH